ncbi:MAG TPA: gamma-glutamyl-phosphate reductase, partial [Thermoclostridium caenicola]|nr:gamma-glutamyl-phosphate reductase [Thermoclostridium caenicola]
MDTRTMAIQAKKASILMQGVSTESKNSALKKIADALLARKEEILEANRQDMERSTAENLAAPLLKRLKFDEQKLNGVVEGIHSLIGLEDPVGKTLLARELDDGLRLYRVSCPIGVIGIIFESRPDALVQISTLCLK